MYIIITTIVSIVGVLGAVMYRKASNLDPKIVEKRLKLQDQLIEEYESEIKHWKTKYSAAHKPVQALNEYNLDSKEDGIAPLIKELLPQFASVIPKQYRHFLSDPALIDIALELYNKDPDRAKSILQGFIKKTGNAGQSKADQYGIPEFDPRAAV